MTSVYGVKLGVLTNGYQCPCDAGNPNTADTCANTTHYRAWPFSYVLGNQSCYDLSINDGGYYAYTMNVSYASNIYTLNIGPSGTFTPFNIPRCSCDTNSSD